MVNRINKLIDDVSQWSERKKGAWLVGISGGSLTTMYLLWWICGDCGQFIWEMCMVRHPFGHAHWFSWATPAGQPITLAIQQWLSIGAAVAVAVGVRRWRRL